MRSLLLLRFLLPMFGLFSSSFGLPLLHIYLSPSLLPSRTLFMRKISTEHGLAKLLPERIPREVDLWPLELTSCSKDLYKLQEYTRNKKDKQTHSPVNIEFTKPKIDEWDSLNCQVMIS